MEINLKVTEVACLKYSCIFHVDIEHVDSRNSLGVATCNTFTLMNDLYKLRFATTISFSMLSDDNLFSD